MDTKRQTDLTEEELAQVRRAMEDFGTAPLTPVVKVETAEEQETPVKKEEQPVKKRRKWVVWVAVAVAVALVIGIGYGYWAGLPQNHPNSMAKRKQTISASGSEIVAVLNDGTVYTSDNDLFSEIARWKEMVSVSMAGNHAVGLRKDGTVAFAGAGQYGRESSQWTNMAAVSVGSTYTLGLRTDGTVVAAGKNDYGRCEVSEWENIIGIEAGQYFSAGLRDDGTVVVTDVVIPVYTSSQISSDNQYVDLLQNLPAELEKVAQWENMIAISIGGAYILGLRADGTVAAAGLDSFGECDVADWTQIVSISAGTFMSMGVRADGKIEAAGAMPEPFVTTEIPAEAVEELVNSAGKKIVAVSCGTGLSPYVLVEDGTLHQVYYALLSGLPSRLTVREVLADVRLP